MRVLILLLCICLNVEVHSRPFLLRRGVQAVKAFLRGGIRAGFSAGIGNAAIGAEAAVGLRKGGIGAEAGAAIGIGKVGAEAGAAIGVGTGGIGAEAGFGIGKLNPALPPPPPPRETVQVHHIQISSVEVQPSTSHMYSEPYANDVGNGEIGAEAGFGIDKLNPALPPPPPETVQVHHFQVPSVQVQPSTSHMYAEPYATGVDNGGIGAEAGFGIGKLNPALPPPPPPPETGQVHHFQVPSVQVQPSTSYMYSEPYAVQPIHYSVNPEHPMVVA